MIVSAELSAVPDQVSPPTEGRIWRRDLVVSHERLQVPSLWLDNPLYLSIQVFDNPVWVMFGDSAVVASTTALNAVTGTPGDQVLTPSNLVSWRYEPGVESPFVVPKRYIDSAGTEQDVTHFSFVSTVAAGFWQIRVSTNK